MSRIPSALAFRFLLPLALLSAGCARRSLPQPANPGTHRGSLVRVERAGSYRSWTLQAMLWWAKLPEPISISRSIELYRIVYWTEHRGKPALASGLMAIPSGGPLRGVVSYQHGTNPKRDEAPSAPSLEEGVLTSAAFAGAGYLSLAPDYVGFGVSQLVHPYLHARSTANAGVDLLRAARTAASAMGLSWNPRVFLVGFSQGGHATAVLQRALEQAGEPELLVRGAASIAGPFDLRRISVPFALQGASDGASLYLAYVARAYADVYSQPLNSLIIPKYAALLPQLYDGNHSVDQILAALPRDPKQMFQPAYLAAPDRGPHAWFSEALEENEAYAWKPVAPLRLYFGEVDQDVSPEDSRFALRAFAERGGNVELIPAGPYDHRGAILHALPRVRLWFDSMSR